MARTNIIKPLTPVPRQSTNEIQSKISEKGGLSYLINRAKAGYSILDLAEELETGVKLVTNALKRYEVQWRGLREEYCKDGMKYGWQNNIKYCRKNAYLIEKRINGVLYKYGYFTTRKEASEYLQNLNNIIFPNIKDSHVFYRNIYHQTKGAGWNVQKNVESNHNILYRSFGKLEEALYYRDICERYGWDESLVNKHLKDEWGDNPYYFVELPTLPERLKKWG